MHDIVYFAEHPGAHYEALYLIPFLERTGGTFLTDDKVVLKKLKSKFTNRSDIEIKLGSKDKLHTLSAPISVYSNYYPRSSSKFNVLFMHGVADKKGIARPYTFKDQGSMLYRVSSKLPKSSKVNPLTTQAIAPFKWFRKLMGNRFDLILLPGQALHDLFKSVGILTKGNNEIIGFPRLDPVFNEEIDRKVVLKNLGLSDSKKTILYAPTWHGKLDVNMNSMQQMGKAIMNSVKNEYNLIVRPHPRTLINNESPEVIELLQEKTISTDNIRLVDDPFADTIKLMAAADLMISDYSSVGIEFLAFDRPVIYADHLGEEYFDKSLAEIYVREAGFVVREAKNFRQTILKALANPDDKSKLRKKYAKYFFGPTDGKAAERGAEAIQNLLK
jgi:hypothetical protein